MKQNCDEIQRFLNNILSGIGVQLSSVVKENVDACYLDIDGSDAALLRSDGDELLDALEHLLNQAFSRDLEANQKIICDVHGFREEREHELKAMAQHAAKKVRTTREPFIFGYLKASERRIIHTALQNENDLQSESFGEANMRRLKISLKD